MNDLKDFNKIYADAGEQEVKAVILYGKRGDNYLYSTSEMSESVKMEKEDFDNLMLKGAKISYDGTIYTPKNFVLSGAYSTVTFGDSITLQSKPKKPTVTVITPGDEIDLLGKTTSDLQESIRIEGNAIYGTLHHITGYTGFSSIEDEQEGYYLATKYVPDPSDGDVHVLKTNGTVGDKVLSRPDLTLVSIITNKDIQKLQVYVEADGVKGDTVEYDLSHLILEE